jgi:hypothetical protein
MKLYDDILYFLFHLIIKKFNIFNHNDDMIIDLKC